jgi:hypothetical protein
MRWGLRCLRPASKNTDARPVIIEVRGADLLGRRSSAAPIFEELEGTNCEIAPEPE